MPPKVTVVIPVFNRQAALGRAIESVLAQTCQDFEIIVVDDGSTDRPCAYVTALADRRITLIRHEQNRGGGAARNTGIRAGSAAYVAFLDSDDQWLPTKLERQLEVFERSSERVGLVYTGAERVLADGRVVRHIPRRQVDLSRVLLTENVVGETSVGMVRRSALDATGAFDESLPSCQDMDLWLRLCERFGAEVVPEALVRVAKGNDSVRISASVARTVWGRELFCRKHKEKLVRHNVLHLYLRESGWWQQRRVGDSRMARRFYRESLGANPMAPFTYALLLGTYLPVSWLDRMARCKHLLIGILPERLNPSFGDTSRPLASMRRFQRSAAKDSASS
jgi:glycosyltransferase involved in cell wall biosynthesis